MLGDREPSWERKLRGGAGDRDSERDAGQPDHHVHDESSGDRDLRHQLHGGGNGELGLSGCLHERGWLFETRVLSTR